MTIEKYITPNVDAKTIKQRVEEWLTQLKGSTIDIFVPPYIDGYGEYHSRRVQEYYHPLLSKIKPDWYQLTLHPHADNSTCFYYFTNQRFEFSDPYLEYR